MLHAKQTVYYTISYIHLMNDFLPDCKNVHNDEDWKKTIIVCTYLLMFLIDRDYDLEYDFDYRGIFQDKMRVYVS